MRNVRVKEGALPEPSSEERVAIATARQRQAQRRPAFRLGLTDKVGKRGQRVLNVQSSHSDQDGWHTRMFEAFGTASDSFVSTQLHRISTLFRDKNGVIDTGAVESVIAAVDGARPANEIEAMLVIQIATTHVLTLNTMKRFSGVKTIQQADSASVALARLQRAFTNQVEALAAIRRGGKQVVEHVHVYPGGQAIVGNVTTRGTRGVIGNGQQPHAAIQQLTQGGSVWSEDAQREPVPISAGQGQETMPDARRGIGIGSPERGEERELPPRPTHARGHG